MAAPLTGAERTARYRRRHPEKIKAAQRDRARAISTSPGICGLKGCERPKHQTSSGKFAPYCLECKRARDRRRVSVRVGYGMTVYVGLAPTPEIRAIIGNHTRTYAREGAA